MKKVPFIILILIFVNIQCEALTTPDLATKQETFESGGALVFEYLNHYLNDPDTIAGNIIFESKKTWVAKRVAK